MEKDERQALFIYERGKSIMNSAVTKQEYLEAVSYFAQISDFNDSADLMSECIRLSENAEKDEVYNKAIDTNDNYEQAFEGRNQSMLEKHIQIIDLQDDLIKRKLF